MIPFFEYTTIPLGPITLQVWGLLVALGMAVGLWVFYARAKRRGLDTQIVLDLGLYMVLGGIIGARLMHVFVYEPAFYLAHPAEIIAFWHGGASSLGGFVGAAFAAIIFYRTKQFTWSSFVEYLDVGTPGFWLGWAIGRVGCFLIHDHPGTLSDFVLAVQFPGGARHDLALYEIFLALDIFIVSWILSAVFVKRRPGFVFIFATLQYAVVRFFLDFLRTVDVRYAGLTPAQWGMMGVAIGLTLVIIKSTVRQPK